MVLAIKGFRGFGFESSLAVPATLPVSLPSAFRAPGSVSFSQPDATEPAESHLTTSCVQYPLSSLFAGQRISTSSPDSTIVSLSPLSISLLFYFYFASFRWKFCQIYSVNSNTIDGQHKSSAQSFRSRFRILFHRFHPNARKLRG